MMRAKVQRFIPTRISRQSSASHFDSNFEAGTQQKAQRQIPREAMH
jgi:hypothetical protein